jgi:tRNA G18 (ribose-2'-O)-methylase SpoU
MMIDAATVIEITDSFDPGLPNAELPGSEGPGLRSATLALVDRRVRIPIRAGIDSLNVGQAAAIAFHRLAGRGANPSPP